MNPCPKKIAIRIKGRAYHQLKEQVYNRDNGQCQVCGKWLPMMLVAYLILFTCAHLSHKKSRGSGGDDTPENTEILCFEHHMKKHGW